MQILHTLSGMCCSGSYAHRLRSNPFFHVPLCDGESLTAIQMHALSAVASIKPTHSNCETRRGTKGLPPWLLFLEKYTVTHGARLLPGTLQLNVWLLVTGPALHIQTEQPWAACSCKQLTFSFPRNLPQASTQIASISSWVCIEPGVRLSPEVAGSRLAHVIIDFF